MILVRFNRHLEQYFDSSHRLSMQNSHGWMQSDEHLVLAGNSYSSNYMPFQKFIITDFDRNLQPTHTFWQITIAELII